MNMVLAQRDSGNVGSFLVLILIIGLIAGAVYLSQARQQQQLDSLRSNTIARLGHRGSRPRFETVEFPNNAKGQAAKNAVLSEARALGWKVVSESVVAGTMKGGQACCLASICLPFGFLAGRTDGSIMVTLAWEPGED